MTQYAVPVISVMADEYRTHLRVNFFFFDFHKLNDDGQLNKKPFVSDDEGGVVTAKDGFSAHRR